MKIPKKTYLVNEEESIFAAANKVLDYEAFKREQEKLLKNSSKKDKKKVH